MGGTSGHMRTIHTTRQQKKNGECPKSLLDVTVKSEVAEAVARRLECVEWEAPIVGGVVGSDLFETPLRLG